MVLEEGHLQILRLQIIFLVFYLNAPSVFSVRNFEEQSISSHLVHSGCSLLGYPSGSLVLGQ